MSLGAKVAAGFLALVVLMFAVGAYQLRVIARLEEGTRHLSEISFEAGSVGLELRRELFRLQELTEKLEILHDPEYAAELDEVRREARGLISRLRALALSAAERDAVGRLTSLWTAYEERGPRLEARFLEWGSGRSLDPVLEDFVALRSALDELMRASRESRREAATAATRQAAGARRLSVSTWLLGIVVAITASALLVRSVLAPLRRIRRGARALGSGDLSHRVRQSGPPELEELAADFNAMADRLEELDRLKRDFVSTVSHELKAPLASMQETLRLLLDGSMGPLTADQQHVLELAEEAGERLSGMIRDLLDLARLEAGGVEFELRRLDLVELAREVLSEVETPMRRKELRLAAALPAAPVPVEADAELLRRVLRNLLSNAIKFTPGGGIVELSIEPPAELSPPPGRGRAARLEGEVLTIRVADSGPGIPDEHKERVFERFHRVDAQTKGSQGTGLGLAIARNVVEGHGGEIRVEDRPGGGSVFVVRLRPAAARDAAEKRPLGQPAHA